MIRLALVIFAWLISAQCALAQTTQCPTPDLGAGKPVANGPTCASQAFVTNHYPSGASAGHLATFADSSGQVLQDGGAIPSSATGANPTAVAGPSAINGVSPNFMRADAAPPVQKATNAQFGIVEGDASTITCVAGVCSTVGASFTASLGSDIALNNVANYFDGPSVAQGSSGTWFASGKVTLLDTSGAFINCKLWDGTTVIDSGRTTIFVANDATTMALSGIITSPAGNIRISCQDVTTTAGLIKFNASGNSKDSTVSVHRLK